MTSLVENVRVTCTIVCWMEVALVSIVAVHISWPGVKVCGATSSVKVTKATYQTGLKETKQGPGKNIYEKSR